MNTYYKIGRQKLIEPLGNIPGAIYPHLLEI